MVAVDHDPWAMPIGRPGALDPVEVGRDTGPMGQRQSCPAFVGRGVELHLLDDALDAMIDGRPATILVGGDAGIGKTRLVEELRERARGRGALAATGVCVPAEGGLPYAPIVGILRDVARQRGDSEGGDLLGRLADGLGFGAAEPDGRADVYSTMPRMADEMARTRLFESILAGFTDLARQTPVVLVVEDLHWADSGTAELLDFLTRNLVDSRVLIVGTYRSEELGRDHPLRARLQELGRHPRVTQLPLTGLDREEMAELIGGIVGHRPDWALLDAVLARSEGNPFFAEELTAARHSPTLSAELQGVVMTRVEGLSSATRLLLQVAATAGATADHELLTAVGVLEPDALDEALAEAVDRQLLVVDPDGTGYRFRHALLREAVDASLLPGERSRLHRALATALTTPTWRPPDASGRAAELALHWWAAGEWAEAYTHSIAAADAAVAVLAFPEAFVHLEHALAALDRMPAEDVPAGTDRLALLERASDAAYHGGDGQRSVDLARAAIDLIDLAADPATGARFLTLLGRNAWAIGDSDAAFDGYRRAAALIPADPPSWELARVMAEDARGLMLMSRFRDAERRCHEAIAVARAVGARAEEGHATNTLGCCRSGLGHTEEGIALLRQALEIAEELDSPEDLNRAYGNLGSLLVDAGRLEEGAALVFDSAAMGEELWGARLNGAAGNSTDALVRLGRFDEAAALLAQIGSHGQGYCTPGPYLLPTAMLIRRGRFDEAGHLLTTADELTTGLGDVQERGTFHMLSAELALEEGRPDDAYEHVEQALALAATTDDEMAAPEMCALGVRALADRLDQARTHGRRVDPEKLRLLAVGLVQEAERLLGGAAERGGSRAPRISALVATCEAEWSRLDQSDAGLWADAVRRWEAAGEPYPTAYCRWREAEALLEGRARRTDAADRLEQAWRVSVDMGTDPLTQQIERLAQRARIALRAIDPDEVTTPAAVAVDLGLTPREVEVLGHLARGETDREIAESLFISKKTVSVHVSNLLRKLDVANRVEAGRIGQAQGLTVS